MLPIFNLWSVLFYLMKVEIHRNITKGSFISSKRIHDVISHYLLSSTSEDSLIPLPCEVISSMAGFFSYTFSTRCPTQPPWTQGDGATPRITSLRWEAQDRLAHLHSPDVTLASDDHASMDTSARAFGLTLLTFGNEELESDWTTTWSRTIKEPQVVLGHILTHWIHESLNIKS